MMLRQLVLLVITTTLLASCGGGWSPADQPSALLRANALVTARPGKASDLSPPAAAFAKRRSGVTSAAEISVDQLLDWAEDVHRDLFPTRQPTRSFAPYLYRYYQETGLYVGVADGDVFLLGESATQGQIVKVGSVSDFAPQVLKYTSELPLTFSVPVDADRIIYPDSYQTPTRSKLDLNTDPCKLDFGVVTYPREGLGTRALPKIDGAPLRPDIGRAMAMKDILLHDNPAFVLPGAAGAPRGCTGSLPREFDKTILRLKALGTEYVYMPQWHWASKRADGSWYIVRAEDSFGPLSDADLRYFVSAAHAAGMKVIMQNQIQGMVDSASSGAYVPPATMENFGKWFVAYKAFMAERSSFFQDIGIDIWEVGCSVCMYNDTGDGSAAAQALFKSEYLKTLAIMKLSYRGKTLTANPPWLLDARDFVNQVDVIMSGVYTSPVVNDKAFKLSVASYKAAIDEGGWARGVRTFYDTYGKTLLITFNVQSRVNALTLPGYMEETACTAAMGDLNVAPGNCIQDVSPPDFALQAIVYEASLEAIQGANLQSKLIVMALDYWETDSLAHYTAYPGLATSSRNKPAEGVLRAWFRK